VITSFETTNGRPVVAGDTAENLGKIKAFIVDPTVSRVAAIQISGRGGKAELIDWEQIEGFGADAVMSRSLAPRQVSGEHEIQAAKGKMSVRGSRVLTTLGFECGEAEDVSFDTETGLITSISTTQGQVDVSRVRSCGSYALVIDPA
jgi:uncharacterized protein YrrD